MVEEFLEKQILAGGPLETLPQNPARVSQLEPSLGVKLSCRREVSDSEGHGSKGQNQVQADGQTAIQIGGIFSRD